MYFEFWFFTLSLIWFVDAWCCPWYLVDEFISIQIVLNENSENGKTSPFSWVNYFSVMTNNILWQWQNRKNSDEFIPIRSIVFIIFAYPLNVCNKIFSFTSEIERWTKKRIVLDGNTFLPFLYVLLLFFEYNVKSLNEFMLEDLDWQPCTKKTKNKTQRQSGKKSLVWKIPKMYFLVLRNGTMLMLFQMLRDIN